MHAQTRYQFIQRRNALRKVTRTLYSIKVSFKIWMRAKEINNNIKIILDFRWSRFLPSRIK